MSEIRLQSGVSASLEVPAQARSMVIFAHGSGSSRFSPRNRFVARQLNNAGFGTLLFDMLTAGEDALGPALRFNVELLATRLEEALAWWRGEAAARGMLAPPVVGLFGASTGAAAALSVAARRPESVYAVVSRGGRPDLTPPGLLRAVRAPVLLIVGGNDQPVLDWNLAALAQLPAGSGSQIEVIPGATHLFEEPGALERAAGLAVDWFGRHVPVPEEAGSREG